MATQADINAHDELIRNFTEQFSQELEPLFQQVFDQLAAIPNPTRAQVNQLFNPIRRYAQSQDTVIDAIVEDSLQVNEDVLDPTLDPNSAAQLTGFRQEAVAAITQQVDEEANTIISTVILAAIAGTGLAAAITALRQEITSAIARIARAFENTVRGVDSALLLIRGRNSPREIRYRYVGGVIAESREFCRSMSGRTMTEAEIRRIWSSQTWAGKRPGDPFVVRGGYNCRHSFVPVSEDG